MDGAPINRVVGPRTSISTNTPGAPPPGGGHEMRRHARLTASGIETDWGPVLDLSSSGMRVRCGIKPPNQGEVFFISIHGGATELSIMAVCRWRRRDGMFHHQIGLEFVKPLPEVQAAISEISRCLKAGADLTKFGGWGE